MLVFIQKTFVTLLITIFNLQTQPMELTEQEPETEPVGQGMRTSEPVLPEIVPGTCVCTQFSFFSCKLVIWSSGGKVDQANRCFSFKNGVFITATGLEKVDQASLESE